MTDRCITYRVLCTTQQHTVLAVINYDTYFQAIVQSLFSCLCISFCYLLYFKASQSPLSSVRSYDAVYMLRFSPKAQKIDEIFPQRTSIDLQFNEY